MHDQYASKVTLQTVRAVLIFGIVAAWTPVGATPLPSSNVRKELPSGLLEMIQGRHLEYARAAARGPRGGAAARGPRGAVARGPQGGVAARGPYGGAAARGPAGNVAVRPGYRPAVPAGR
jgi:hypothetical protein